MNTYICFLGPSWARPGPQGQEGLAGPSRAPNIMKKRNEKDQAHVFPSGLTISVIPIPDSSQVWLTRIAVVPKL